MTVYVRPSHELRLVVALSEDRERIRDFIMGSTGAYRFFLAMAFGLVWPCVPASAAAGLFSNRAEEAFERAPPTRCSVAIAGAPFSGCPSGDAA